MRLRGRLRVQQLRMTRPPLPETLCDELFLIPAPDGDGMIPGLRIVVTADRLYNVTPGLAWDLRDTVRRNIYAGAQWADAGAPAHPS